MRRRVVIAALVVLAACSGERRAITDAVRDYNAALVVAFRTGEIAALRGRATEKEVRKVEALVDLKRNARLVLESELAEFGVVSVERSGTDGALVRTNEKWRYHDRALEPGKPAAPTYVSRMTMQYELERRAGVWRVAKARTITNEFLEPRGFNVAAASQEANRE